MIPSEAVEALRERFGKYHVLDKIAQGGMAEVYKVKTIGIAGFEKIQALKRILPQQAREGRFIRSFIDEARIAVELTHRNIVQVFDFGKADGELFMAMELIEGRDLRAAMMQAVSRDVPCPTPVAAYIISEVAAGLDYAHRKTDGYGGALGIVHCDVSPSNVMLSVDGYVKILDFGIARATFSSALERRRLRGKPRYMAPEQTLGEPPTAAADVFALGIIAWELFTGLPLYRGQDVKSILEAVRKTEPMRIDRMNPRVPKEIVEAVALALTRDPAERGTAADVAAACTRAAMTSGARHVAGWLKDLDERAADSVSVSWNALPALPSVAPPSVPRSAPLASGPPLRESTRSMTGGAAAPPPMGLGDGTRSIDAPLPPPARVPSSPPPRPSTTANPGEPVPPPLPPPDRTGTAAQAVPLAERTGTAILTDAYQRAISEPAADTFGDRGATAVGGPFADRGATAAGGPFADRGATAVGGPFADRGATAAGGPFADRGATAAGGPFADRGATAAGGPFADRGTTAAGGPFADRGTTAAGGPFADRATTAVGGPTFMERATTTGAQYGAFGDRDPTGSVTVARQFAVHEAITPIAGAPKLDVATATGAARQANRWDRVERTAAGVGKLQDAFDVYEAPRDVQTDAEVPSLQPRKYEKLEPLTGTNPAALQWNDDDATQFGFAAPDAKSFNDLQVELDDQPMDPEPVLHDEPIDDNFGALATAAPSERRRTVVVAAILDGAAAEILRPIAKSLGELAYQRGGVVLRLSNESVLIAFGLEVAGEDDVAVAMGWALDASAMTRDVATEHASTGPRLRIGARTGVATASVTATDDGPFEGGTTVSRIPPDAIDEARALAREAQPDRPLFVGVAGRVTSGLYELREVPTARRSEPRSSAPSGAFAAIARRGRVIEVLGPRGFGDRDRARLERRGSFVGRTTELTALETWFQRAIAADRRLAALVTGPAGVGKSRLVAELVARRQAEGNPMHVITTAANPASRYAPFALVIDLYQAALGLPPSRGRIARQHVVQRLLHLMKEAGVSEDRARPVALDLDRAMELRDGVAVSHELADLRPRISAGLAAFRAAMTDRASPLLTIIEDVHLSDTASLEVLRHTLAVTALGPELLILTSRSEGAAPPPPVDVVIEIGDLVGAELRALVNDRLGDVATPLNVATVLARAGGNPLFVEELAQAVREQGNDVPATARDVIVARVDRLSPKAKTALRYGAVLGSTIRARLLEELMDEQSLEAEFDELVDAGFLVRSASAPHSNEGELAFARGLVREVIYDSLSSRVQREHHARIGRLLASRFFAGREEPPAVIADHMERGGEIAGAAAFWLRAGKLALAASDAAAAVTHFTRTLDLERELGDAPPSPTSRARRREALAGREEANRMLGDVVSNPGDLDELAQLSEGDTRRLADVSIRRAHRLLRLADYAAANEATVLAEDLAIAVDDARLRGEALRVRSEILERLGRFEEALVVVDDARELFSREGAVAEEMAAMVGRGRIHLMRAHYEAARDAYRPVISRIEKTGDPWLERIVQNHVAIIEMCLGNFALAMTSAQRSLELCRRYGDRSREGDALSVAGIILLEVGLYDQAAAKFADALDLLTRTASRWSRADCLIYAGVCEVKRGRAAGIAMIDEALAEARTLGARYLEANALVARAGAHLRGKNFAAAIADATEGGHVARAATLVGYEIQGLARHAVALARGRSASRIPEALQLVERALALLDQQRYLEGSEEEAFANCAEVLLVAGAADRASAVRAAGRAEVERKLAGLSDPVWRAAYSSIRENKLLLDAK